MDVSQTLSDLPAGKYRLSANTIGYQQGDMALTPEGVYIYARVQGAEYKGEAHTLEFGAIRGNDGYVTDAPTPRLATLNSSWRAETSPSVSKPKTRIATGFA